MTKNKEGETIKSGRPSNYKEEYNEQSRKLCLLGSTDKDLADFFNVCEATINNWKNDYPLFLESIRRGKDLADGKVAESLYHRALGYKTKETKLAQVDGEFTDQRDVDKFFPPDTAAAIFWLKNRQSKKWRDKQDVEHSGNIDSTLTNIDVDNLSQEEAKQMYLNKINEGTN